MTYYNNPWKDAIPVPIEELAECHEGLNKPYFDYRDNQSHILTKEEVLSHWRSYGIKLDAYILPSSNGFHSIGVRYGNQGSHYLSPLGNKDKVQKLLDKYIAYV